MKFSFVSRLIDRVVYGFDVDGLGHFVEFFDSFARCLALSFGVRSWREIHWPNVIHRADYFIVLSSKRFCVKRAILASFIRQPRN